MAEVDNLTIKITSSATAASNALDKLIKKLQGLQSATNGSGLKIIVADMVNVESKTKSATNALSGFLSKFTAITAIVKLLKSAISESMNYTETFNYFNVAMKNYTAQAEEYAQKVNSVMGINVEQWENAQATFMSLGTTFGLTGDKANLMSQQLTQLTYDLASLKNVDPTVALQKMRSAFAGEIEPLRAWGVDLSKANLQLAATELGITKTFNAMTQAEKAQLRYYVIMKQTTDAQGDMARTLQSPANQLRILKQALTECARALGNIFIPVLQKVIPILIVFVRILTFVFEAIAKLFGFKYPDVQWYGDYTAGVGGLGDEMDKTRGKAKKLKQQLAGFDEINNLTTNQPSGGGGAGLGGAFADFELPTYDFLGDLAEKGALATETIKALLIPLGALVALIGVLNYTLTGASPIGFIIAGISLVIAGLVNLYETSEGFRTWVDNTWAWLKDVFGKIQDTFNRVAGAVIEWLVNAATDIAAWFVSAWDGAKTLWNNLVQAFTNIKTKAVDVWTNIKTKAVDAWNGIKSAFQNIPVWFGEKWQLVKDKVAEKWANIKQGAVDAWTGIKETFAKIPAWFKEKFSTAWQKVKDVFSTGGKIFDGIKEGIANAFRVIVNGLIKGINKVIAIPFNAINAALRIIRDITILGISPFKNVIKTFTVPQIPYLATGGVITNPTVAMIGENGAEAIVPLENNTEWINKVAAQINSTGNNDDVVKAIELLIDVVSNKELIVDGKSLARGISKEINRQTRIMGEGLVY